VGVCQPVCHVASGGRAVLTRLNGSRSVCRVENQGTLAEGRDFFHGFDAAFAKLLWRFFAMLRIKHWRCCFTDRVI